MILPPHKGESHHRSIRNDEYTRDPRTNLPTFPLPKLLSVLTKGRAGLLSPDPSLSQKKIGKNNNIYENNATMSLFQLL